MKPPIYLDYNATTPLSLQVVETMRSYMITDFGNPSSSHWYGDQPALAVEKARQQVAALLNCQPDEIVFTSGGTESNNHAMIGSAMAQKEKGNHIITTAIEHPAVLEVCKYLAGFGVETTIVPVDGDGMVNVYDIEAAIRPETTLITVMHANNEVGTIQSISEISELVKHNDIVVHTDAAQSIGKIPTDIQELGVDLLSIAGHKMYAPKGVGALFIKAGTRLDKFCHGAGQESGYRAGTENIIGIAALGKACELSCSNLPKHMKRLKYLRDRLYDGISTKVKYVRSNGSPEKRLPNTLSISFHNQEADRILDRISDRVAASAGAACHSDTVKLSHVIEAMKIPEEWAKGTIRFSVGRMTTEAEIDQVVNIVAGSL